VARQNTAALAKDLGREPQPWEVYLAHQQGIEGATALLHADPNAGAAGVLGGSTDKLMANGIPADATAGQALGYIKNYVDKHAQMYEPNGVPTAHNIAQNYEQHIAQLAEQARIDNPGDPTAPERYQRNYAQQAAQQLHSQQMTHQANRRVLDNSLTGPNPVMSWKDFMADPARVDAYQAIFKNDKSVYDRVNKAITTNALIACDPPATEQTQQLYNQLSGMSSADREGFAQMDLNPYYGAMPASQYYDLVKTQQKIQDKDAAEAEKHVKLTSALTSIKSLIKQAGVTPDSPYYRMDSDSGLPGGQKQYNDFVSMFGNAIDTWQQNNQGKIPTATDIRGIAQDILFPPRPRIPANQTMRDGKSVGANTGKQPAGQPEIPSEASAKYEAILKAENYPITPANLKALYEQDQEAVAK